MARVEMTMTELLSKRKMYEKRLNEASMYVKKSEFIGIEKNGTLVGDSTTSAEQLAKIIRANFDSYKDLLNNYQKLTLVKNAVNATITVNIAGQTMTMAEALSYMSPTFKSFATAMIDKLKKSLQNAKSQIASYEETVLSDKALNEYITACLGTNNTGVSPEVIEILKNQFISERKISLIDPLNLEKLVEDLYKKSDEFYTNINFVLSAKNAMTKVWIDFSLNGSDCWGFVTE